MKAISSDANPHFRDWMRLAARPHAVREAGRTLAEGLHLATAALDAGTTPEAVLVRRGADPQVLRELLGRLARMRAPAFELSPALFDRLAPVERGVGLMLVIPVTQATLPERLDADVVYLDGVQDPGNAGALLRVAAAAGIRLVCTSPTTTALWAPKVLRGSQGAHFSLRLCERVAPDALRRMAPVTWVATSTPPAQSLWTVALPRSAVGWMFGSEGQGLSPQAEALCTLKVSIPTSDSVESLNVVTAAAICLFERKRRVDTGQ